MSEERKKRNSFFISFPIFWGEGIGLIYAHISLSSTSSLVGDNMHENGSSEFELGPFFSRFPFVHFDKFLDVKIKIFPPLSPRNSWSGNNNKNPKKVAQFLKFCRLLFCPPSASINPASPPPQKIDNGPQMSKKKEGTVKE